MRELVGGTTVLSQDVLQIHFDKGFVHHPEAVFLHDLYQVRMAHGAREEDPHGQPTREAL